MGILAVQDILAVEGMVSIQVVPEGTGKHPAEMMGSQQVEGMVHLRAVAFLLETNRIILIL